MSFRVKLYLSYGEEQCEEMLLMLQDGRKPGDGMHQSCRNLKCNSGVMHLMGKIKVAVKKLVYLDRDSNNNNTNTKIYNVHIIKH